MSISGTRTATWLTTGHSGLKKMARMVTADTAQSEQAFSVDGGKTWEVNWKTKYTRMNAAG